MCHSIPLKFTLPCNYVFGIWILLNYFSLHICQDSVLLHLVCLIKLWVPASSLPASLTCLGVSQTLLAASSTRKTFPARQKKTFLIVLSILLLNSVLSVGPTQLWRWVHHYRANRCWHLRVRPLHLPVSSPWWILYSNHPSIHTWRAPCAQDVKCYGQMLPKS